jgi:aarF domain-containing kinase
MAGACHVVAILVSLSSQQAWALVTPSPSGLVTQHRQTTTRLQQAASISDTTRMMQEMRERMNEDDETKLMMQALRGQNLNDDDAAMEGLEMKLVNVAIGNGDVLPFDYDPVALQKFFKKRPGAVLQRITQVLTVVGGFLIQSSLDSFLGRLKRNPDLEVQRAAELRDIITSLGPFFIKIGQALSIRPDVLSPRSMVELQKLCDKVPSYDSKIAFATIEKELGRSIDELFSEITPEPVAAASLGQVYKATLRATGEVVAVKVQRPSVLETVSLDLFLAREAGIFSRNFPSISSRLDAGTSLEYLNAFLCLGIQECSECTCHIPFIWNVSFIFLTPFLLLSTFYLQSNCWTSLLFDFIKNLITIWNAKTELESRRT